MPLPMLDLITDPRLNILMSDRKLEVPWYAISDSSSPPRVGDWTIVKVSSSSVDFVDSDLTTAVDEEKVAELSAFDRDEVGEVWTRT
jgi:hypothetical protein